MKANCCPTCGRAYPRAKIPTSLPEAERAVLSAKDLYAYYAARSPFDDLAFIVDHADGNLAIKARSLLAEGSAAAIKLAVPKLRSEWRASRLLAERIVANRLYPVGEPYDTFKRVAALWQ